MSQTTPSSVPSPAAVAAPQPAATLLLVDDEANILSSLRRLFRPEGYRVLTAESGDEALELIAAEPVDMVVSDMRMPGMNGAQLLARIREAYPDTVRILLTGYADIASTIDAINKGEIYRYVAKPWDDNDLRLLVREALEGRRLRHENQRLSDMLAAQNEQLRQFNTELEAKVKARTLALSEALANTDKANKELKQAYTTTVRVFCELVESRGGLMTGHGRRVADLARSLGRLLGVGDADQQTLVLAGLLHDLGKIGLPDELLEKPFTQLRPEERGALMTHPVRAESLLMGVRPLAEAAKIIRSHHEHYDGTGYPDGLAGLAIPRLARILAVANAFDSLQLGTMVGRTLSPRDALAYIESNRGKRYDPEVVDAMIAIGAHDSAEVPSPDQRLRVGQLTVGMTLARDLLHAEGYLLLSRGFVVDQQIIEQLARLERNEGRPLHVYVLKDGGAA